MTRGLRAFQIFVKERIGFLDLGFLDPVAISHKDPLLAKLPNFQELFILTKISACFLRRERPMGAKDKVKRPEGPSARSPEVPCTSSQTTRLPNSCYSSVHQKNCHMAISRES